MAELEEIYKLYFRDVYKFIYGLSRNKTVAEDITSETFLKALKSIDTFKGESDVKVWLFQIAKYTYYSYLRQNKKETSIESIGEIEDKINIERIVFLSEESMNIHKILHQLKEPYKEVFTLRVFGDLSFKQIGEVFRKSDNWACVTFYRAKEKIKEEMEKNK